ncbi:Fc receptor-like protein 2 [Polypterus senegalus]|uniref:Fc receptor-like protein 2 n=1 Tax=Polypterus senegalus TaxID=55291 RepID=UPI001964D02A|nr:Fc receptor-like protein 2 [Polypterus senegalus]
MHTNEFFWIAWLMAVTSSAYAEKNKVTLRIKQNEPVYTGDNVTLECSIESDLPNWRYRWHEWSSSRLRVNNDTHEHTYMLKSLPSNRIEVYWCAAFRDDHPYYFRFSNAVILTDKPKMTLKMFKPVHIGDTLTLKCSMEGGLTGWRYTWYKLNWTEGSDLLTGTTGDTYTVQSVTQSDTGVYWCAGERDGHPQYSDPSNAVTLSFQEKLNVTLKMRNQKELFNQYDNVTLECRIEEGLPGWRYRWFKSSWLNEWMEIPDITEDTFVIEEVSSPYIGEYWCLAVRDDPPDYSEVSNSVTVNVQDLLRVTPKIWNQSKGVGENVTLRCNNLSSSKYGTYYWTKWSQTTVTEWRYKRSQATHIIPSATQYDSGLYWCYGSFSLSILRDVYLLTVQATKNVTLKIKNPKVRFYTGDNVTLECSSDSDLSGWTYRWYHLSQAGVWNELDNTTEDTYTLQSVAQSEGGKYWCYAFIDDPLHYTDFSNAVTLTVQVGYSIGNGIRIGLSFLVLILLLVLVSECFWIRVLSISRSAEGDSEGHQAN